MYTFVSVDYKRHILYCLHEIVLLTSFAFFCRVAFSSCLVLCYNWQGSTPIPQWEGEFGVGGGVHDSYTFQCGTGGIFYFP